VTAILPPSPDDDEDRREALGCTYLVGVVLAALVLLVLLAEMAVRR